MCEDQPLHTGFRGDLGGFARGGVTGLESARSFFGRESRLVNENIGAGRSSDGSLGWARISGENDASAGTRRTDELRRLHRTAVGELYRLTLVNLAPQRTLGHTQLAR